ncbi:MAG TPA: hypothetical protein VMW28_00145 [Pelolinea sp.]|nr:hypothetical protein [Pelolinea sp.]
MIKAVAIAAAITAMLISAWLVEGLLDLIPFAIFVSITAIAVWLALKLYQSLPRQLS